MTSVDTDLILKCKDGNLQALEKLYQQYSRFIINTIYKKTGRYDIAEDVAQETFIDVLKHIGKLRNPHAFKSWLYKITINNLKMVLKREGLNISLQDLKGKQYHLKKENILNITIIPQGGGGNLINYYPDPSKIYEEKEVIKELIDLLEHSSPMKGEGGIKKTILLYYYYGFKVDEIAKIMSCPEGTVKSRLHYGRKRLKEIMEEKYAKNKKGEKGKNELERGFIKMSEFKNLKRSFIDLSLEDTLKEIDKLLDEGCSPKKIFYALNEAMEEIGTRFENQEMYMPEVMIATQIMKKAFDVLQPEMVKRNEVLEKIGTVVMGTVKGDVHTVGKDMVIASLSAAGFEVIDLGVDVPPSKYIEEAIKNNAQIIAASAIMTVTMPVQKDLIDYLKAKGLRDKFKVIVGGGCVTQAWADEIGADGYGKDAIEAVEIAKKLVS